MFAASGLLVGCSEAGSIAAGASTNGGGGTGLAAAGASAQMSGASGSTLGQMGFSGAGASAVAGAAVGGSAGSTGADGGAGTGAAVSEQPAGPIKHRVLSSISHQGPLAIVDEEEEIEWQYDVLQLGDEANDAWLLPSGNLAYAYKKGAQELTQQRQVVWNFPAPGGSEIQSCQPLPGGHFLIAEAHDGGVGYLRELDGSGKEVSSVTVDVGQNVGAHGQFRQVRKTPQGTYLASYNGLNKSREYGAQGQLLREFPWWCFCCRQGARRQYLDQLLRPRCRGRRAEQCRLASRARRDPGQPLRLWISNLEVLDPAAQANGAIMR
jgi:hypothetical protein